MIFCCCISKHNIDSSAEAERFLETLHQKSICFDELPQLDDSLVQKITSINKTDSVSLAYFVDGSCSDCIAKLLKVMNLMHDSDCKIDLCVIVEQRFHSSVENYIETLFPTQKYNMLKVANNLILSKDYNGLTIVVKNNKILHATIFIDAKE